MARETIMLAYDLIIRSYATPRDTDPNARTLESIYDTHSIVNNQFPPSGMNADASQVPGSKPGELHRWSPRMGSPHRRATSTGSRDDVEEEVKQCQSLKQVVQILTDRAEKTRCKMDEVAKEVHVLNSCLLNIDETMEKSGPLQKSSIRPNRSIIQNAGSELFRTPRGSKAHIQRLADTKNRKAGTLSGKLHPQIAPKREKGNVRDCSIIGKSKTELTGKRIDLSRTPPEKSLSREATAIGKLRSYRRESSISFRGKGSEQMNSKFKVNLHNFHVSRSSEKDTLEQSKPKKVLKITTTPMQSFPMEELLSNTGKQDTVTPTPSEERIHTSIVPNVDPGSSVVTKGKKEESSLQRTNGESPREGSPNSDVEAKPLVDCLTSKRPTSKKPKITYPLNKPELAIIPSAELQDIVESPPTFRTSTGGEVLVDPQVKNALLITAGTIDEQSEYHKEKCIDYTKRLRFKQRESSNHVPQAKVEPLSINLEVSSTNNFVNTSTQVLETTIEEEECSNQLRPDCSSEPKVTPICKYTYRSRQQSNAILDLIDKNTIVWKDFSTNPVAPLEIHEITTNQVDEDTNRNSPQFDLPVNTTALQDLTETNLIDTDTLGNIVEFGFEARDSSSSTSTIIAMSLDEDQDVSDEPQQRREASPIVLPLATATDVASGILKDVSSDLNIPVERGSLSPRECCDEERDSCVITDVFIRGHDFSFSFDDEPLARGFDNFVGSSTETQDLSDFNSPNKSNFSTRGESPDKRRMLSHENREEKQSNSEECKEEVKQRGKKLLYRRGIKAGLQRSTSPGKTNVKLQSVDSSKSTQMVNARPSSANTTLNRSISKECRKGLSRISSISCSNTSSNAIYTPVDNPPDIDVNIAGKKKALSRYTRSRTPRFVKMPPSSFGSSTP